MTDEPLRVEWSARKRCWTVRVRTAAGRKRIPLLDARSEAEAIALAPHVAAAAKAAVPREAPAPKASKTPRPTPSKPRGPTVLQHVRTYLDAQTYTTAAEERKEIENHLAPAPFGLVALASVSIPAAREYVRWLLTQKSVHDGKPLAARSVHKPFAIVAKAIDSAVDDELISANPMRARAVRKLLPKKRDKIAGQRERRKYALADIVALLSDARVPADRRTLYALLFSAHQNGPGSALEN